MLLPIEKVFIASSVRMSVETFDNVVALSDKTLEDDADVISFWLKNDFYNLRFNDHSILQSPCAWLSGLLVRG